MMSCTQHCMENTERSIAASCTGNCMPGAGGVWTAGAAGDVPGRRAVPAAVGGLVRTAPSLYGDTEEPRLALAGSRCTST
jgi:hypothetical protein